MCYLILLQFYNVHIKGNEHYQQGACTRVMHVDSFYMYKAVRIRPSQRNNFVLTHVHELINPNVAEMYNKSLALFHDIVKRMK